MMTFAGRLRIAAAVLAVCGLACLWIALATPAYSDPEAYQAAFAQLYDRLSEDADNYKELSATFFANQDRFATNKWLYADIGYALISWAAFMFVLSLCVRDSGKLLQTTKQPLVILLLALFAIGLSWVGVLAAPFQAVFRGQVPPWADSLGIPIGGATAYLMMAAPTVAVVVLAPLLFRPLSGRPILRIAERPYWRAALSTLMYAPFLAFASLLVVSAPATGGWATSVAGAMLAWLFLNARALASAPSSHLTVQTPA